MTKRPFGLPSVLVIGLAVAMATSLPYLLMLVSTDSGYTYLGLKAVNSADHLTYAAWMRQAADGNLWFKNLYSTESSEANILLPFFWVLGRGAGLLGIDVILFQHLARALFAMALVVVCWHFAGVFLRGASRVRAFLLLALGTGLPGLIPEASPISAAYDSALLAASWTLLMAAFGLFYTGMHDGRRASVVLSGVIAGVLAVIHPYDAVPLGTVMALATLLPVFPGRPLERVARSAWAVCPFLLGVWFTASQVLGNPVLADWATDPRPFSWWGLLSFGALWLGAAAGMKSTLRSQPFLWLWLIIGLLLLAVPTPIARRLIQGLQAPLVILATLGFETLVVGGWGRISRLSQASLYPATAVMLFIDPVGLVPAPALLTDDQVADIRELATLPAGAVLADPTLSYVIPPLAGRQVYCGNYSLTIDYERKIVTFEEVMRGTMPRAPLPTSFLLAPIEWVPGDMPVTPVRTLRTFRVFEMR
jgi:hypothetical protein